MDGRRQRGYGEDLLAVLDTAGDALAGLPDEAWRLSSAELTGAVTAVGRLVTGALAGLFTLTQEATSRGEVAASQAGSTADWLTGHTPQVDPVLTRGVAKALTRLGDPRYAPVLDAIAAGDIAPSVGVAIRAEFDAMARRLQPGAEEAVIAGLLAMGRNDGAAGVRRLRPALLVRYGLGEDLQHDDDRQVGGTTMSAGRRLDGGLWDYRVRLTDADRAILEAALNALSRPDPDHPHATDPDHPHATGPDEGRPERDPRTPEQRRGDALVDLCRRATAVASSPATAAGMKACVFITLHYDDLAGRTRGGTAFGTLADDTVLGPETIRRFACDAGIIPVILGGPSEVLDVGTTQRLFTTGQVKTLWLRDRRCTFPGCTTPATWCDAHHLIHWIDDGPTDLSNAALLCGRHHTIVHRDRLAGRVTPAGTVFWDRIPGSYDHHLARWRAAQHTRYNHDYLPDPPPDPPDPPPDPTDPPDPPDLLLDPPADPSQAPDPPADPRDRKGPPKPPRHSTHARRESGEPDDRAAGLSTDPPDRR